MTNHNQSSRTRKHKEMEKAGTHTVSPEGEGAGLPVWRSKLSVVIVFVLLFGGVFLILRTIYVKQQQRDHFLVQQSQALHRMPVPMPPHHRQPSSRTGTRPAHARSLRSSTKNTDVQPMESSSTTQKLVHAHAQTLSMN